MANGNIPDTQISTADIQSAPPTVPPPSPMPAPMPQPVAQAPQLAPAPMYPLGGPTPAGIEQNVGTSTQEEATGVGVEGETVVWEAHYAYKNFLGRFIWGAVFAVAWLVLAYYTWGRKRDPDDNFWVLTALAGIALAIYLLALLRRVILARYGHYYKLTNRRLFVSTGLFARRRDQMELLRVQDVYTKQTLTQRWLALGSVVVVSTEPHFPILYLTGVDDPKGVMDLVWHHARSERDRRSVKVDQI